MKIWIARYILLWVITLIGLVIISIKYDLSPTESNEHFGGLVYVVPAIFIGLWWAIGYLI